MVDCNDVILITAIVMVLAAVFIYNMQNDKKNMAHNIADTVYQNAPRVSVSGAAVPEHMNSAQRMRQTRPNMPRREHMNGDPSQGMPNGATGERRQKMAALTDARKFDSMDLFPDKEAMTDEWKEMFSHAENTLAQENFVEPSYEYSLGAINIPKRYLTHDLRGMPPVITYDNLSFINQSPFAGLDINETTTRRAGDL